MRVHHATAAYAAKNGLIVAVADTNDHVVVTWPERNKTLTATDPKQGVADMVTLRMLTLEYPKLKATQVNGEWNILSGKTLVGAGDTLQAAWEEAAEELAGDDEGDEDEDTFEEDEPAEVADEEEPEEDASHSIVKPLYKARYKPHHQTCGDDFAKKLSAALTVKDEDGRDRIDPDLLREFAIANDVWVPSYAGRNIGQQRMNIGNRLRAKIRKGHEVVWD